MRWWEFDERDRHPVEALVPRSYRGLTEAEVRRLPIPDDPLADSLEMAFRKLERDVAIRDARAKCEARGYHGETVFIWGSAGMTCLDCGSVF